MRKSNDRKDAAMMEFRVGEILKRGWLKIELLGPIKIPNEKMWLVHLSALRSDNVDFMWDCYIEDESINIRVLSDIKLLILNLDDYVDCACVPEVPCERHKMVYNPRALKNIVYGESCEGAYGEGGDGL